METTMSAASSARWDGVVQHRCSSPRRAWEIAAIIVGFIFFWPAALAYLIWKLAGYPLPAGWRSQIEGAFQSFDGSFRTAAPRTGNSAFEEYRRAELARLEEERRRLDEESRAFAQFVEELKRAKDREEFDAFMAKRRGAGPASV
jgi:Protein of unknown function (DUF2852)